MLQDSQLRVQWGLRTSSRGLTALLGLAPPSGLVPSIGGKVRLLVLEVLLLSAIPSSSFGRWSRENQTVSSDSPWKFIIARSLFRISLSPLSPLSSVNFAISLRARAHAHARSEERIINIPSNWHIRQHDRISHDRWEELVTRANTFSRVRDSHLRDREIARLNTLV